MADRIRQLKAEGFSDQQIAQTMGLTLHQVFYIRSIYGIPGKYRTSPDASVLF
jgi:hypothetical protein